MSDAKKVTNTTTRMTESGGDVAARLTLLMGMGVPGAIERQEAEGQRELVASQQIPTEFQRPYNTDMTGTSDELLIALGFELGEVCDGDPIFREAKLPPGWTKAGTDHDMWSKIVDDKGRERFAVFYKAAFYDRSAHMNLTSRYFCGRDYEGSERPYDAVVKDGSEVLWRSDGTVDDHTHDAKAHVWLDENRPGHRDPIASWDL